jgi:hypothetical protein
MKHRLYFWILLFGFGGLSSCRTGFQSTVLKKTDIAPLCGNDGNALVYRTTIDLYKNHFSGILVYKQTDSLVSHIVFVTEIGMKIFDFEVRPDSVRLAFAFPGFESRPKAIQLLESDFGLIFLQGIYGKSAEMKTDSGVKKTYFRVRKEKRKNEYVVETGTGFPLQIIQRGRFLKKMSVDYSLYEGGKPKRIFLKHKGFIRLRIEMNKLEKT